MIDSPDDKSAPPAPSPAQLATARRAARLAAVQAIYQMEFTGTTARQAIGEFRQQLGKFTDLFFD